MGATRFDITTTGDTAGSKLLPVVWLWACGKPGLQVYL